MLKKERKIMQCLQLKEMLKEIRDLLKTCNERQLSMTKRFIQAIKQENNE